jgi:hypothetical protein
MLSGAQLNATATVPGTFTYNPAAGTVLNADSQTLFVAFSPADTTDYTAAKSSVTIQDTGALRRFDQSVLVHCARGWDDYCDRNSDLLLHHDPSHSVPVEWAVAAEQL